jgi:IS30 family transposase
MRYYTQLTQEQRYQIYALLKMDHTQVEIAKVIGVHKSTISRELQHNRGLRGYRPKQAHRLAVSRRDKSKPRIGASTWTLIEALIRQDLSPEQISDRLKKKHRILVSHERIYQYILADKRAGGDLYRHLRCQKKHRKRYGSYDRRGVLPNRVSIDERPAIVDTRQRLGDWEADTIVGKRHRGALVTLSERKSRLTLLKWVERRTAQAVADAVIELLQSCKHLVHTITSDNGKEFADHERIAKSLEADFYFAHPYAAWERGTNENSNGLVRQYFPKNRDFTTITEEETIMAQSRLNNHPRKCLDFDTPYEVFFQSSSVVALSS